MILTLLLSEISVLLKKRKKKSKRVSQRDKESVGFIFLAQSPRVCAESAEEGNNITQNKTLNIAFSLVY